MFEFRWDNRYSFYKQYEENDPNSFRLNGGYKLRPEMLSFQSDLYFNEADIAINADKFVRSKKVSGINFTSWRKV